MTILVSKANEAIRRTMGGWRAVRKLNADDAAKHLGMSRSTLKRREEDPASMTIAELRALISIAACDEAEIIRMVTGRKK